MLLSLLLPLLLRSGLGLALQVAVWELQCGGEGKGGKVREQGIDGVVGSKRWWLAILVKLGLHSPSQESHTFNTVAGCLPQGLSLARSHSLNDCLSSF